MAESDGTSLRFEASTNWSMECDCPEWALTYTGMELLILISFRYLGLLYYCTFIPSSDDNRIVSEWKIYDIKHNNMCREPDCWWPCVHRIECAYQWHALCSSPPPYYKTEEEVCWTSAMTPVQGFNGSVSLPERVVMHGLRISYADYNELYDMEL